MSQSAGPSNRERRELAANANTVSAPRILYNNTNGASAAARHTPLSTATRAPLQQKRIPSPLQTSQTAQAAATEHIAPAATARGATTPRSPSSSAHLVPAPAAAPSTSYSDVPLSPNRVKGSSSKTGDWAFEAVKAAASRDALLEQAQGKQIAREESREQVTGTTAQTAAMQPASPPAASMTSRTSASPPVPMPSNTRKASLDSTSSNSLTSSASQALRPSTAESSEPVDVPAIIAAAGSVEHAILKLVEDKKTASSHSAQLWRLVEKQRNMIMGLNKDLERAMKDKERYRRKLKDNLIASASLASMPSSAIRASVATDRDDISVASPAVSDPPDDLTRMNTGSSPNAVPTLDRSQSVLAAQEQIPSPLSTQGPMHSTPMQAPFSAPPQVRAPSRAATPASLRLDGLPDHRIPTGTPPAAMVPNPIEHLVSPTLPQSVFGAAGAQSQKPPTPTSMPATHGFSSPKDRSAQASRKAPPAPLDLSYEAQIRQQNAASGTEHDTDDGGEATPVQRGRRKTRRDDDRGRDLEATQPVQEPPRRSPSVRSRTSRDEMASQPEQMSSPERNMSVVSVSSGYSSPEEPGSPHIAQVQTYQSLNALNAVLKTPQDGEYGADVKRSLAVASAPSLISPGLPLSPRPGDRPVNSPVPRAPKVPLNGMPMTPRTAGLPLSPRAPRQAIPLPPQTPLSIASPHLARAESYRQQSLQSTTDTAVDAVASQSAADTDKPSASLSTARSPGDIYRGFVTEQCPGLLLPPNALPSVFIKVDSSRLRPARYSYMGPKHAEENPVFTLAVYARSDNSQLWRLEKTLLALAQFDQQLKASSSFRTRLPDRNLFAGHAPARIDARRSALGLYFDTLLDTPMDEHAAAIVCSFLSADAIGAESPDYFVPSHRGSASLEPSTAAVPLRPRKDGYLTKKGKNFGGWKARYFVCDGPSLKYFEAPGGSQLGAIKLQKAQIGKQKEGAEALDADEDEQFRHAILVVEPKRKDSSSHIKHVLCAESDEERDAWIDCLLAYVGMSEDNTKDKERDRSLRLPEQAVAAKSPRLQKSMNDLSRPSPQQSKEPALAHQSSLRAVGYNQTVAAEAPVMGPPPVPTPEPRAANTPSPPASSLSDAEGSVPHPAISAPTNGTVIQNAGAWGNKNAPAVLTKEKERDKERKRSIFAFRGRSSSDIDKSLASPTEQATRNRPVFGIPLAEVCEFATPTDAPVQLPAVFYRCIEYLRAKDAAAEEGIFRLSGSNIVIKALRERYNTEGDVKLLAPNEQYYDIHAVAGLLKLYLRELPSSILTRELHLDFLRTLEISEHSKPEAFNVLVNRLPRANRELLEQLSAFLREIVDNEAVNKMSVRNVGIVFAPTLNIPAPLITLFVTDHSTIFGPPVDIATTSFRERDVPGVQSSLSASTLPSESLRSPQRQMFGDMPTPSYSQPSFSRHQSYESQQQMAREAYDTGFSPMSQTFVHPPFQQPPNRHQPKRTSTTVNGTSGGNAMSTIGNLNEIHISSSPLMGGESPEMNRDRGFEQPGRALRRQSGQFLMNIGLIDKDKGQRPPIPKTPAGGHRF